MQDTLDAASVGAPSVGAPSVGAPSVGQIEDTLNDDEDDANSAEIEMYVVSFTVV